MNIKKETIDENTHIICGDCLQILPQLNRKYDLILTDIPYGTTHCKWDTPIPLETMWNQLCGVKHSRTPVVLFGNEPFSSKLRLSNLNEYKYDWMSDKIIRTGHLNSNRQPLRQYENIIVFYKKQPTYNPQMWIGKETNHPHKTKNKKTNIYGKHHEVPTKQTFQKYPSNIIQVNARNNECNNTRRVHPTQKPVKLLEYIIRTYTDKNDNVLDFTMGSGSTGVACQNTHRKFTGIEIDPDTYQIAKKRLEKNTRNRRNP